MLVLSRKVGERIWIGDQVAITVVRINGGAVRLGIEAPADWSVARQELLEKREASGRVLAEPLEHENAEV